MTREEAIKILNKYDLNFCDIDGNPIPPQDLAEACDMAIEALEQELNEDLISRKDVIDGLEYEVELYNRALDDMDIDRKERDRFEWELELVECFIENIKELPSKDKPKWIPVSERLPEEEDVVLICSKIGVIDFGKRKGDKWVWLAEALWDYWQKTEDLIAWMPLPEAYKESDTDGSN